MNCPVGARWDNVSCKFIWVFVYFLAKMKFCCKVADVYVIVSVDILSGKLQGDCKVNKWNRYVVSSKRKIVILKFKTHTLISRARLQNRLQNFCTLVFNLEDSDRKFIVKRSRGIVENISTSPPPPLYYVFFILKSKNFCFAEENKKRTSSVASEIRGWPVHRPGFLSLTFRRLMSTIVDVPHR